ncbi:Sec-independent protein translocase family protein [Actinotalea fermentans]|uniref:Translocase n=1 Tax=Actinotalea fermentans TaxID=43671 RepID=A0A511YWP9_9CELL|nr:Sec-independent protein translocase TatB [Actinotalea fermentans]GEN79615.1 translocase [Actinotalea fermentans]
MFGINGGEFVVLLLIAAVVVGPERLPRYAEQLAQWVRTWRSTLSTTKERLSAELGEDDVDWTALDPRRYDPRRIVRDALLEPERPAAGAAAGAGAARASAGAGGLERAGGAATAPAAPHDAPAGAAPYDDEAT